MTRTLKKKISFIKYSSLVSKDSLFFVCLFINNSDFSFIRKELIMNQFTLKFSKNKLVQNLFYFKNIKKFITSKVFLIYKEKFKYSDILFVKNLLLQTGHIHLFYLDRKFYSYSKLIYLCKDLLNPVNKFTFFCSLYLILKVGFFLKFDSFKINLNKQHYPCNVC